MSKFEKIQRNSYAALKLLSATGTDFDWDYKNYHDARSQLHEQAEHGWGVAAGLEVEPVQPNQIQVRPGVAIDGEGKLIALSDDDIPPKGNLGWQVTKDFKGSLAYVTIEYGTDIKKNKSITNKQLDLQVFEPTVSLVAPEDLKDPTKQLVLAIVELNEDRTLKGLAPAHPQCPYARKLVGVPAGEIRLRRSKAAKDGDKETVSDTEAVTIRPTKEGDGVELAGGSQTVRLDVTGQKDGKPFGLKGMTFGEKGITLDGELALKSQNF